MEQTKPVATLISPQCALAAMCVALDNHWIGSGYHYLLGKRAGKFPSTKEKKKKRKEKR